MSVQNLIDIYPYLFALAVAFGGNNVLSNNEHALDVEFENAVLFRIFLSLARVFQ